MTQVLPERFQGLFREHYPLVLRRLIYLVGDRAIAEDLAQEVFLRLYRSPPDDFGVVGAWLHRVSTRVAYDYSRKKSVQRRMETHEFASGMLDGCEPSSELHVLKRYERETVKYVLQQLSDRDRQVLLLRYSGYSYTEIAEIVQVNPKIVGTMLNRALSRFERKYHDEEARADEG